MPNREEWQPGQVLLQLHEMQQVRSLARRSRKSPSTHISLRLQRSQKTQLEIKLSLFLLFSRLTWKTQHLNPKLKKKKTVQLDQLSVRQLCEVITLQTYSINKKLGRILDLIEPPTSTFVFEFGREKKNGEHTEEEPTESQKREYECRQQ